MAFINFGADYGKPVIVIDVANEQRVLIEGVDGKFPRCLYPLKRLSLTRNKVEMARGLRTGGIKKVIAKEKLAETW